MAASRVDLVQDGVAEPGVHGDRLAEDGGRLLEMVGKAGQVQPEAALHTDNGKLGAQPTMRNHPLFRRVPFHPVRPGLIRRRLVSELIPEYSAPPRRIRKSKSPEAVA